jgi:ABC-2 type transport system permease protein
MRNVWLIARREYLERVRARSFMIMTVLIPMLMGGLVLGASLVRGRGDSHSNITVVTRDPQFGLDLQADLQGRKDSDIAVDVIAPPGADTRQVLDGEIRSKSIDGYLWVKPAGAGNARPSFEWVPRSKGNLGLKNAVGAAVGRALTREGLSHSGMGNSDVNALMQQVELKSAKPTEDDNATAALASAGGLFFLMYFVILFYGMNVARSIIEEKTSRVFEVLLATIRPEEMMAGKVIGVGAVGLTQVGIWIVAALILMGSGILVSGIPVHLTVTELIFFVVFFLLGYLLYSSVAAALGAMTSSEQELQQMNIFLMLPLIACTMVFYKVVTEPDGALAKAFSYFPFCTPLMMYMRIAAGHPAWYEIAGSIVGLVVTILAVLWVASRIYRVGVLMYGKRPNLPEILRWLKYS